MKPLVNPLTVRPHELRGGDVMAVVVTCHVVRRESGLYYRLYRCPFPPGGAVHDGIPQGARITCENTVASQLFPVVQVTGAMPG